ncbi:MAG: hypothetical protein PHS37_07755, partial [Candidatus Omnitrophica bacterium]|nr:hypothetical protein [Candidatus Omnitrophota bacterium]
ADNDGTEHPDLITDSGKQQVLLDHFGWFFSEIKKFLDANPRYKDTIYAWDIMNEPEMSCEKHLGVVSTDEMTAFIRAFAGKIHSVDDTWQVTVGSLTKGDMVENWIIPDNDDGLTDPSERLDLYQFHYYDSSVAWHPSDLERLDFHRTALEELDPRALTNGKMIIAGETDPTYVTDKLDIMADHGYDGVLFWDDKKNILDAGEHRDALDWTFGSVKTYYLASGRLASIAKPSLDGQGTVYEHYLDEAFYNAGTGQEQGRIDKVVLATVDRYGAKAYDYVYCAGDPGTPRIAAAYHTADYPDQSSPVFSNPVVSYRYDSQGNLLDTTWNSTYYTDTWYIRSRQSATPDEYCVKYRYYVNGNSTRDGNGKEWIEHKDYGSWQEGVMYEYWDNGQRHWVHSYNKIDYTDPTRPVLSSYRYSDEYDQSGNYVRRVQNCPGDPFIPANALLNASSTSVKDEQSSHETDARIGLTDQMMADKAELEKIGVGLANTMGQPDDKLVVNLVK